MKQLLERIARGPIVSSLLNTNIRTYYSWRIPQDSLSINIGAQHVSQDQELGGYGCGSSGLDVSKPEVKAAYEEYLNKIAAPKETNHQDRDKGRSR